MPSTIIKWEHFEINEAQKAVVAIMFISSGYREHGAAIKYQCLHSKPPVKVLTWLSFFSRFLVSHNFK